MKVHLEIRRPLSWQQRKAAIRNAWLLPFQAVDWIFDWTAYFLSNWKFLETLEYLSSLGVLVAVVFYFADSGNRTKLKHYQAWQVINTAQGKGGSGGRIRALEELNADGIALVGVDVSGAFLQGIQLPKAKLLRANFAAADVRGGNFASADLSYSDLHSANFRDAKFSSSVLYGADIGDADLTGADLSGADLSNATLENCDLRNTELKGFRWQQIKNVHAANIFGVRNAPEGFIHWALQNGAIESEADPQ